MKDEIKPLPCPWCKGDILNYYEGSHDWCFNCVQCQLEKGFYVPHVDGEGQIAIQKWNEWVESVNRRSPLDAQKKLKIAEKALADARCTFWMIYSITTGQYEHDLEAEEISDLNLIQKESKRMFEALCALAAISERKV